MKVPCGIDQAPYFKICRDMTSKLDYPKPALIQCKLFSSLMDAETKMFALIPETSIFITDAPKVTKKDIECVYC